MRPDASWHTCREKAHRGAWYVLVRRANYSSFNGGRRTMSAYSAVHCPLPHGDNGQTRTWRTKAAYVNTLPDKG